MAPENTAALANPSSDLAAACRAVAEHSPLPMLAVEGPGLIVCYVNPAFGRLLAKPREQLVGHPFGDLLPQLPHGVTLLDRVFLTGEPASSADPHPESPDLASPIQSYIVWPLKAGGRTVGAILKVVDGAGLPERILAINEALLLGSLHQHELTDAAESVNARLMVEADEHKKVEALVRRTQAALVYRAGQLEAMVDERTSRLTAANNRMEDFVYSIAHDLRAPLRAMEGFSSLLLEEAGGTLNETCRGYAERIQKSARFMDALLIDLLAFSCTSQQRIELTSVNLGPVVESVVLRLKEDISEKRALLEAPGPWPVVLAHEATLAQVLFNLMANALKFSRSDRPPIVRLGTETRGEFLRVWVEDDGLGIPIAHQSQVFRLFTRLNGDRYAGAGIGLAIVQNGVERMGGRVGVESLPGEVQGTRFWCELRAVSKP